jgi:hypothetical protein
MVFTFLNNIFMLTKRNLGRFALIASFLPFVILVAFAQVPEIPVLSEPADGSTDISTSPTFIWNEAQGANTYNVQFSTQLDFSSTVFSESALSDTQYNASGLDYSTTYYWRVEAVNDSGGSGWSSVWSFTTIVAAPSAPTLASPNNGETGGIDQSDLKLERVEWCGKLYSAGIEELEYVESGRQSERHNGNVPRDKRS